MKARLSQGSIASFIIIGVVLVLVTTGVLYWIQHKDGSVARKETPAVSTPEVEESTPKEQESADTDETSPPAATATPSSTPEAASAPAPTVTMLSETGPADTAFQLIAVGALVATAAGFARSRNLRSSL